MSDIKEMNVWQTIKDLPNRVLTLVWKMLSVKGMALVGAWFLVKSGAVSGWEAVVLYLFITLMVIGGREASKWMDRLKELKG